MSSSVNFDLTKNEPRDKTPFGACSTSPIYVWSSPVGAREPEKKKRRVLVFVFQAKQLSHLPIIYFDLSTVIVRAFNTLFINFNPVTISRCT